MVTAPGGTDSVLDPDPDVYKRDVDRTLLRANLASTVDERLRNLIALQSFAEEVRRAAREARQSG